METGRGIFNILNINNNRSLCVRLNRVQCDLSLNSLTSNTEETIERRTRFDMSKFSLLVPNWT